MKSELSNFATRLREHIIAESPVSGGPDCGASGADGNSWRSSLQREGDFNALALELFALQIAHNAAYRRICEARTASPSPAMHWSQIPAVPAAAFKELELTCLPPGERAYVFYSSGTTQQRPSRHFHNAQSLAVYEESLWSWFNANGCSPRAPGRLMVLTPPLAQAPHSSLVHMFETIRRRLGATKSSFIGRLDSDGAWRLDLDAAAAGLASDSRLRTADSGLFLLGTAFSFVHLLDFLEERNLRIQLPPGSCVLETGGYKGRSRTLSKPDLHALITERLGVPPSHILCEYGMSELSSQAYDRVLEASGTAARGSRVFHFPRWSRARVVSPETGREVADGETGLLRVFDLANVFSVMAIQTEDLGIRRGDGFELVGRAELAEPRGCSLMAV
jgi:hypothetical protein